jgi:hypothetical protein
MGFHHINRYCGRIAPFRVTRYKRRDRNYYPIELTQSKTHPIINDR